MRIGFGLLGLCLTASISVPTSSAHAEALTLRCMAYPTHREFLVDVWTFEIDLAARVVALDKPAKSTMPIEAAGRMIHIGAPRFSMIDGRTGAYFLRNPCTGVFEEAGACEFIRPRPPQTS